MQLPVPALFVSTAAASLAATLSFGQEPQSTATAKSETADVRTSIAKLAGEGSVVCGVAPFPGSDGRPPTLVASLDFSGRHFCNQIVRVRMDPRPVILQQFDTWWLDEPASVVRDVDHDGEADLVIPRAFSLYEGAAACVASLPVAYRCSAETCTDVSTQSPGFYTDYLRQLEADLAVMLNKGPDDDTRRLPCIRMESDKAHRILGLDSRAGFELAEEWMKSADVFLRRKAVALFADIDDAASRQHLATLVDDADVVVRNVARHHVTRQKR